MFNYILIGILKSTICDVKATIKNEIIYPLHKKKISTILYFHTIYLYLKEFVRLWLLSFFSLVVFCLTLHATVMSRLLSQHPPMAKGYKSFEEQFSTTWEKSSHALYHKLSSVMSLRLSSDITNALTRHVLTSTRR